MEKKNKRHDAIFWPILVLLLGVLVAFLVSGCDECGCNYPELQEEDNFTVIARQYFYSPTYTSKDNRTILPRQHWDIYKIKYEGHYYTLWMINRKPVSITPDLLHETPTTATPANSTTPYNNLDYESIFGKK